MSCLLFLAESYREIVAQMNWKAVWNAFLCSNRKVPQQSISFWCLSIAYSMRKSQSLEKVKALSFHPITLSVSNKQMLSFSWIGTKNQITWIRHLPVYIFFAWIVGDLQCLEFWIFAGLSCDAVIALCIEFTSVILSQCYRFLYICCIHHSVMRKTLWNLFIIDAKYVDL